MRGNLSDNIKPDDMLLVVFGREAPQGYVAGDSDESTCTTVFYRDGSLPQRAGMNVLEFDRLVNGDKRERQGAPCPV